MSKRIPSPLLVGAGVAWMIIEATIERGQGNRIGDWSTSLKGSLARTAIHPSDDGDPTRSRRKRSGSC